MALDAEIRMASFEWLGIQSEKYIDGIPRTILEKGFEFHGERITLVGPQGIWKPVKMSLPISITTIVDSPYNDSWSGDSVLKYDYRGTNPFHNANSGLRNLMETNTPLIYFLSVHKGFYFAEWPVFIVKDDPQNLCFFVDLMEEKNDYSDLRSSFIVNEPFPELNKSYKSSQILVRLHQKTFRERVLQAYSCQCSLCKLKHRELLDAAHIISDRHHRGDPVVQNGITLCKIHHAAFDSNIIGIAPDFSIMVRKDILKEIDGPMLKFGIQDLNGRQINLPSKREFYPDKDRLEERFDKFLKAG